MYTLLTFVSLLKLALTNYEYNENDHNGITREADTKYEAIPDDSPEVEFLTKDPGVGRKPPYLRSVQVLYPTEVPKTITLKMSSFPSLYNKQIGATKVHERDYHWIAKVFHSKDEEQPYLCTAACIRRNIFITAARCIAQAKLEYMHVSYMEHSLKPYALVLPTTQTKQMFDDIGFIVTNFSKEFKNSNTTTISTHHINRNSTDFKWFQEWRNGTVVGHVVDPTDFKGANQLYKIDVTMSTFLCETIYNLNYEAQHYYVPCYHTCDLVQDYFKDKDCENYLGGEGHIVLESDKIIGISTWGYTHRVNEKNHPVGMAVVNSQNYKEDFKCALKINRALMKGTVAPTC